MDYMRSCYTVDMFSFVPGVTRPRLFLATWYKAPSTAIPIGIHHQYASGKWTKPTDYKDEVGEDPLGSFAYYKGTTPAGVVGTNYCGTQWTGKLFRLTTPLPNNAYGQPSCCALPPVTCTACAEGVGPSTMYVVASGGTGDFAVANGTWPLVNSGTCRWITVGSGPAWVVEAFLDFPNWGATLSVGAASAGWSSAPTIPCMSPYSWGVGGVLSGVGTAPAITTQPSP